MHVLILPSWYPSNASDINGIFFRQQAQAIRRRGWQVGVIAPQFRSLRGQPFSVFTGNYGQKCYIEEGIHTYTHHSMLFFPRLAHLDRLRWLRAGMALFEQYLAEQGQPDILHAHCVESGGILAQKIAQKYHIPYVITEHSSTYARGLIKNWQIRAMKKAVQTASARIAVSPVFCQQLEQFYGNSWQYLPNMLNPIFTEPFDLQKKETEFFHYCAVARLDANKGIDNLLYAFADARQQQPQLKLSIAGCGAQQSQLKHLAKFLKLGDSVIFLGQQNPHEIRELLRNSHALVSASHVETFGIVLIEALSQGLPVIATASGGSQGIIHQNNGLLVSPNNIPALAIALRQLPQQFSQYHANTIRQQALEQYSARAVTDNIIQIYQHII